MKVYLDDRLDDSPVNSLRLKRRLSKVLKSLCPAGVSIGVLLAGDSELQALNLQFRGKDCPTNVLAFPFRGPAPGDEPAPAAVTLPPSMNNYLGDVALSMETVTREASQAGTDVGELMYFYLIHGILHLLGHDHELGQAEAEAQDRETERLMKLIPHTLG
ncbi:MAG: rRNA maturation RNase YbeY [Deltaproteobacteria bacterium]|jgi:probable rRNA maturation factor|nr:rRNA maturation RNase YbeY [Deltaproteobacteria bacterium]